MNNLEDKFLRESNRLIKKYNLGDKVMGSILNAKTRFKSGIEFDGCEYTVDEDGNFGVRALSKDIELYKDKNGYHLKSKGGRKERQALAELLWVAATLIDSEGKYKPDMDMIGINYER